MRPTLRPLLLALAALAAAPAAAQQSAPAAAAGVKVAPEAAPSPDGVEFAETTRTRAMILTVDEQTREILMRDLDTGAVFIHRPPEGIPLSVTSGDVVTAIRTRAATARPASAADADATESDLVAAPDAAGQGFMGGRLTRTVMTLEAWNPVTGVAVVRTPEGETRRYNASAPEARAFVETLKPGDRIDVEFSDTVRVQVER